MSIKDKSKAIVVIEKIRLLESEIFSLVAKYGIKTIDELDLLLEKGKLSEKEVGSDLYLFDYLLVEKEILEKELKKLNIGKDIVWQNLQSLLGLPKLSIRI